MRINIVRPVEYQLHSPPDSVGDGGGVFAFDDEDLLELRGEHSRHAAVDVKKRLEWLLAPPESAAALKEALAAEAGGVEALAARLRELGWAVKLNTSAGGGLHSLRHTFLTLQAPTATGSLGAQDLIVDPSFSDQYVVAHPTPRFALVQAALPKVVVASPHRVRQAVMLMAGELERAFRARDIPLPPWRRLDALLTKYEAATSVEVLAARPVEATGAAPAKGAGVSAAQRAQRAKLRVEAKLAQWGLQPTAPAFPSGANSKGAELAGASPTSVVLPDWASDAGSPAASPPARRPQHTVLFGFQVNERVCGACDERVCCGPALSPRAAAWLARLVRAAAAGRAPKSMGAARRQLGGRGLRAARPEAGVCAAVAA